MGDSYINGVSHSFTMKILSFHILVLLTLSLSLNAQVNLVPNPSFEIYDTCPIDHSYFTKSCTFWYTPMSMMINTPNALYSLNNWGSSDYYNTCSVNPNIMIPHNSLGFQNVNLGNAYAGIFLITNPNRNYIDFKEYIETTLNFDLFIGIKYCVEFYYSIAEYSLSQSDYYPIEIGVLFTDTVVRRLSGIGTDQPQNIYDTPQISQKLPETKDTLNWIKVSGSFIAQGGEQYLTIGNFQHTDTLTDKNVYVYIDDVSVYYCGLDTTLLPIDSLIIPNVFTPNGDGTNDRFEYKNQEQWEFETLIYNRWEVPVYHNKTSKNWDGTFEGNKVSPGVYFYIIKARAIQSGKEVNYRGTVTVMY